MDYRMNEISRLASPQGITTERAALFSIGM
jgi:hypothetical protein